MWTTIGRGLLYGFTALGVADLFGIGGDSTTNKLWKNPIVIIALLVLLLILLKNLSKLKLT